MGHQKDDLSSLFQSSHILLLFHQGVKWRGYHERTYNLETDWFTFYELLTSMLAIVLDHALINWQPFLKWHDFVWLIELWEDGSNFKKGVFSDFCVVNHMEWGHYFIKSITLHCIWNAFIVYITVKWPIHVSSWNRAVARCDQDPIDCKELIHTQTQLLVLGLGWVQVGHFNGELSWGWGWVDTFVGINPLGLGSFALHIQHDLGCVLCVLEL